MWPILSRGPSLLCVVISASMKLSSEIFALQYSPYAVSKFEISRPTKRGENGWEHIFVTNKNQNMNIDKNYRSLNSVCISQVF